MVYTEDSSRPFGDRLRWSGNLLPTGASLVNMYFNYSNWFTKNASYMTGYQDYVPEEESEEPEE